jgi:hypothetical protein
MSNNTRIEVKDGVAEGDLVLLNPRAVVPEAREEDKSEESVDIRKKFGDERPTNAAGPNGRGGPGESDKQGPGGDGGPRRKGGRGNFDIMAADKNGDKKVSLDEAPEQMKQVFDRLDSNSDGFIDAKEAAEARRRMMERQQEQGEGPGRPAGGPAAGQGG